MIINLDNLPKWDGKDFFRYKGNVVQQNPAAFHVFSEFFKHEKFNTIIEIGTAGGGWSLFLKENCDKYHTNFITYDIQNYPIKHENFINSKIDFRLKNVFENIEEIECLIKNSGRVALFCDGGDKIKEFNTFAKSLKINDFILAHDYAPDYTTHFSHLRNVHWDWCEIADLHVEDCMKENNIVKYFPEYFLPTAWLCAYKHV